VIDKLDRALKELLERELVPGLAAQMGISFAAPDSDFPPQGLTIPAVDLFLYDVRENLELRSPGLSLMQTENGSVWRKRPLVWVDCSYLITAWASENSPTRPFDEHHLLSEVMKVLLRHPRLPDALLPEDLRNQAPQIPTSTLQPGRLQSVSEFWQALGGKPKAALNYTLTIGIAPDRPQETEAPVIDKIIGIRPGLELGL
jgi:hypothetical protein